MNATIQPTHPPYPFPKPSPRTSLWYPSSSPLASGQTVCVCVCARVCVCGGHPTHQHHSAILSAPLLPLGKLVVVNTTPRRPALAQLMEVELRFVDHCDYTSIVLRIWVLPRLNRARCCCVDFDACSNISEEQLYLMEGSGVRGHLDFRGYGHKA